MGFNSSPVISIAGLSGYERPAAYHGSIHAMASGRFTNSEDWLRLDAKARRYSRPVRSAMTPA